MASDPQDPQLRLILDRFDEAWSQESLPEIVDFLPGKSDASEPARKSILMELVMIDLQRRWKRASSSATLAPDSDPTLTWPTLEDYVARYPELGPVESLPLELICREYRIRQQWGDRPDHAKFLRPFQAVAEQLKPALCDIDRELSLEAEPSPTTANDQVAGMETTGFSVLQSLEKTLNVPRVSLRELDSPLSSSVEPAPGQSGRRYQVDGEIARGGMGAILKGRDNDLGRDLAIKVLLDEHKHRPGMVQRFVEEAQIGGQLQHPGIAPVYELGQFDDSRLFFSMKLVKGQTLSKLLAERKNLIEDRGRFLGIFEEVCQTLAYAHARGVIHRDLKPANIMVGAFGEVQVMDWGLAKVLSTGNQQHTKKPQHIPQEVSVIQTRRSTGSDVPGSVGSTGSETEVGSVLGTPAYMPPEQALGEVDVLDQRADVFALGAILCEVLTGKPPYVGADRTAVFRLATRGKLDGAFSRLDDSEADAELIELAKECLASEADARPRDANAVAERISQYRAEVDNRLRKAQAEGAATRARLMEQRKRKQLLLLGACFVCVLLLIGGTAVSWQWWRAQDALAKLNTEQQKTQERVAELSAARQLAVDQLEETTKSVGEWVKQQPTLTSAEHAWIDRLLVMWEEIAAERGGSPEARALRAKGHFRLGYLKSELGRFEDAERDFLLAKELYQGLTEEADSHPQHRQFLGVVYFNLAKANAARGSKKEAENQYASALNQFQLLLQEDPGAEEYRHGMAMTYINLATLREERGDVNEAKDIYLSAIRLLEALTEEFPSKLEYQRGKGFCHNNVGIAYQKLGAAAEAERELQVAIRIRELIADKEPQVAKYQAELADTQRNLATFIAANGGSLEHAEQLFQSALRVQQQLVADFPGIPSFQRQLAQTHSNYAIVLREYQQRLDEAADQTRNAMAVAKRLVEQYPAISAYKQQLAMIHINLGGILTSQQSYPEGERELRTALKIYQQLLSDNPSEPATRHEMASCLSVLAAAQINQGQFAEAQSTLRETIALQDSLISEFPELPEYRDAKANSIENIAKLLLQQYRPDQAESEFRRAIEIREKLTIDCPDRLSYRQSLGDTRNSLGRLLLKRGAVTEYEVNLTRILANCQRQVEDFPQLASLRINLVDNLRVAAAWYVNREQYEQAQGYCRRAIERLQELRDDFPEQPMNDAYVAEIHNTLGSILSMMGQRAAAIRELQRARTLLEGLPAASPQSQERLVLLGGVYCNLGLEQEQPQESLKWYALAVSTLQTASKLNPQDKRTRQYLSKTYSGRIAVLKRANRFDELVADLSRLIELSATSSRPDLMLDRAEAQLNGGNLKLAMNDLDALAQFTNLTPLQRYRLASITAVACENSRNDDDRELYGERAIQRLREAVESGWKPTMDPAADPNLRALWERGDFRQLGKENDWGKSSE